MKKTLTVAFSLVTILSFAQTNTATPDPNNNGVPIQHTTYPTQPSIVTTNPVDRGDVNNNIRPDTTFLKGQSEDITPRTNSEITNPPKKTKPKNK